MSQRCSQGLSHCEGWRLMSCSGQILPFSRADSEASVFLEKESIGVQSALVCSGGMVEALG